MRQSGDGAEETHVFQNSVRQWMKLTTSLALHLADSQYTAVSAAMELWNLVHRAFAVFEVKVRSRRNLLIRLHSLGSRIFGGGFAYQCSLFWSRWLHIFQFSFMVY